MDFNIGMVSQYKSEYEPKRIIRFDNFLCAKQANTVLILESLLLFHFVLTNHFVMYAIHLKNKSLNQFIKYFKKVWLAN